MNNEEIIQRVKNDLHSTAYRHYLLHGKTVKRCLHEIIFGVEKCDCMYSKSYGNLEVLN